MIYIILLFSSYTASPKSMFTCFDINASYKKKNNKSIYDNNNYII